MPAHNRKRSNTISALKRKNLSLTKMIDQYKQTAQLSTMQAKHLDRLQKDAGRCANFSLYGNHAAEIKYFASVMCGNKCCFVCNFAMQKRVRRKYFNWFKSNPTIYRIRKADKEKFVTRDRFRDIYEPKGYSLAGEMPYDIMHCTLTVPHYAESGFNGNQYYFDVIADLFHNMRNEAPGWNDLVFGGEYGIETTRNANGLHIHIHSLLFVRQVTQNRNKLHLLILREWNKRTGNRATVRDQFDPATVGSIKRSNRLLTPAMIEAMNPKGTTMINLETIYSYQEGIKVRTANFNSPEMLYAVMEAIKYHFEPLAFDKENKEFDFDLMTEIMPVIYKKQLYKKFGCLHGEKSLNVKETGHLEEDYQDATENLNVDEETGEIVPEYDFFVLSPAFMYHIPEKDNELVLSREGRKRLKKIQAFTVTSAVAQLGDMVKATYNRKNPNN